MKEQLIAARIILKSNYNFNAKKAFELLKKLVNVWPKGKRVIFIITCGGFINFKFPWEKFKSKTPYDKRILKCALIEIAKKEILKEFSYKLRKKLRKISRYLTIGIDAMEAPQNGGRHIVLVALIDLKNNKMHFTGKSLPTNRQERQLIREEKLESHFVESPYGTIMLLGCHDLNFFNPRGIVTAKGWRKSLREKFIRMVRNFRPKYVIQHPHYTDSNHIWKNGWAEIMKKLDSVEFYCSAWKYGKSRNGIPRESLEKVLKATTNKPQKVIDFYYNLN